MAAKSFARAKPNVQTAPSSDVAEACYGALALLAGARGIITELEDHAVPDAEGHQNVDRLLAEVIDRLKRLADEASSWPMPKEEAAND